MSNTQSTLIKHTKAGVPVTYKDGTLYVGGRAIWSGVTLRETTKSEREQLGSVYTHAAGVVMLTSSEAVTLRAAIPAQPKIIYDVNDVCPRCGTRCYGDCTSSK